MNKYFRFMAEKKTTDEIFNKKIKKDNKNGFFVWILFKCLRKEVNFYYLLIFFQEYINFRFF